MYEKLLKALKAYSQEIGMVTAIVITSEGIVTVGTLGSVLLRIDDLEEWCNAQEARNTHS